MKLRVMGIGGAHATSGGAVAMGAATGGAKAEIGGKAMGGGCGSVIGTVGGGGGATGAVDGTSGAAGGAMLDVAWTGGGCASWSWALLRLREESGIFLIGLRLCLGFETPGLSHFDLLSSSEIICMDRVSQTKEAQWM